MYYHSPSERWRGLNADAAWEDVIRIYKDTDKPKGIPFLKSLEMTLHIGSGLKCESLMASNCEEAKECNKGADGPESGPAAKVILESLMQIHQMFSAYHVSLFQAAASEINNALDDLENKFAPIPPEEDDTWELLLINLVTLGTLTAAGPFFNSFLTKQSYFLLKANKAQLNNIKDTTMTLIRQSTTIAKDLKTKQGSTWTTNSQDSFSNYMGQVIAGWGNMTSARLHELFNGEDKSIETLWEAISDGKLAHGKTDMPEPEGTEDNELRANIAKTFFGFAIPALWRVSSTYAFVIDSGYGCDEDKPLSEYLDDRTMKATGACVDGRLYYLAHPDGVASECKCHYYDNGHCQRICTNYKFSVPPGLESLDGRIFGGITTHDLIKGSVRTYQQNGKKNGGGYADASDTGTVENLLATDVTTPGFMRIPVCSPARAFQAWDKGKKGFSDNYPCDLPPGTDTCGDSTFENQSSGGSPLVEDCRKVIAILERDLGGSWKPEVVGKRHREIADAGTCHFGVEATSVNGNVNFEVGAQDVIDIINESIKRFGGSGRVGAKGTMGCNGNIKQQSVKWGIY